MIADLAPVLLVLQEATGFRILNGQIVLHVGNGSVQKVEMNAVVNVSKRPSLTNASVQPQDSRT